MKVLSALFVLFLFAFPTFAAGPATVNNDDSCDVIVTPAATLLLPYFEVDLSNASGETTLFTIANVTQLPQIARVTVWTDRSFPVLDFNIFLTGYDIQSINVYDLIARGRIAEPGTSSDSEVGDRSLENDENPLLDIEACNRLAVHIPIELLTDIQTALTVGRSARCANNTRIGGEHVNAIGYITIDVVQRCGVSLPTDPGYFTDELLYDNVLTGDYQQVNSSHNSAQAGTMVHIRAIPEGGPAGVHGTNFARTFYSNYQNGGTGDRRQPLPSTYAARWIGSASTHFDTSFKIWREGVLHFGSECAVTSNGNLGVTEIVRFDENENPAAFTPCQICSPPLPTPTFAATSRAHEADIVVFPPNPSDDAVAGWMYMNFDHDAGFPFVLSTVASQNWVVVSMEAAGRYSADFDAASLGNGCSFPAAVTDPNGGDPAIAPAPNAVNAVFASSSPKTLNNDDSCDIKVTPAATLLLPYFEVDLSDREGETTLFTITNVTALPRIARLTIWTDRAYPLVSFNVFLTGYDVQSINLFDVLALGKIAQPGSLSDAGRRSKDNDANPLLDVANCGKLPEQLPDAVIADLRSALTTGRVSSCGTAGVGNTHSNALGYLTIDVVKNCESRMPIDAGYFSGDVLYDNALIGDYQQVNSTQNSAQSNAMVHIRAIPEGGAAGSVTGTFPRTFYSRLQGGGTTDRRQPLPSAFAAHWISGGISSFETNFKIWRDGTTGANAGCAVSANAAINVVDFVRFDEEENPTALVDCNVIILCPPPHHTLPSTARVAVASPIFPANTTSAVAGWMYLNLDDGVTQTPVDLASQSWVIVSMRADGRYSGDFDATALGNGCSPPAAKTDQNGLAPVIAPAPNANSL